MIASIVSSLQSGVGDSLTSRLFFGEDGAEDMAVVDVLAESSFSVHEAWGGGSFICN